jgi:hypothetical protein
VPAKYLAAFRERDSLSVSDDQCHRELPLEFAYRLVTAGCETLSRLAAARKDSASATVRNTRSWVGVILGNCS